MKWRRFQSSSLPFAPPGIALPPPRPQLRHGFPLAVLLGTFLLISPRTSSAAGCHVAERPIFGLNALDDTGSLRGVTSGLVPSRLAPRPCSGESASDTSRVVPLAILQVEISRRGRPTEGSRGCPLLIATSLTRVDGATSLDHRDRRGSACRTLRSRYRLARTVLRSGHRADPFKLSASTRCLSWNRRGRQAWVFPRARASLARLDRSHQPPRGLRSMLGFCHEARGPRSAWVWALLLSVTGCGSNATLDGIGLSGLQPSKSWTPADPASFEVPGRAIAAWRSSDGASLVVVRALASPRTDAAGLAKEMTSRLENLPELRIVRSGRRSVGGVEAAIVEIVAPGKGDALAPSGLGKPLLPLGRVYHPDASGVRRHTGQGPDALVGLACA